MKYLFIFIFSFYVYAEEKEAVAPAAAATTSDKKIYSEKEFKEKVDAEVKIQLEKSLKRFHPSNVVNLSIEILEKEKALQVQIDEFKRKEETYKNNELSFIKNVKAFEESQSKVIGCIEKNNDQKSKRIETLADVVSNMKPQNAADLLSVQDTEIAVKVLELIDTKKVSKIFNLMNKEISARLQKEYMNMKKSN